MATGGRDRNQVHAPSADDHPILGLSRLAHAVRHAHEHWDSNVCTKARELVRSIRCESFEETERRASKFNGLLRKVGHRLKEQQLKNARSRISVVPFRALRVSPSPAPKTTRAPLGASFSGVAGGMFASRRDGYWRVHALAASLPCHRRADSRGALTTYESRKPVAINSRYPHSQQRSGIARTEDRATLGVSNST